MSKLSIGVLLGCVAAWSQQAGWQGFMTDGNKLRDQARYADAERSFTSAVRASEDFAALDSRRASSLNSLATIIQMRGRYQEAESLFREALAIWEQHPGQGRLSLAVGLSNLANLLRVKGQYPEAERLCLQAVSIQQTALGQENPAVAETLYILATIQAAVGRYAEAESTLRRTLAIQRKTVGVDHPSTARTFSELGYGYFVLGRYAEAEPLYRRALAIRQSVLGPDDPEVALTLNKLAELYIVENRPGEAEKLWKRAIRIWETALGPDNPGSASVLNNLGILYLNQGRTEDAEGLFERALSIQQKSVGGESPDAALMMTNLAGVYQKRRQYPEAKDLYYRALAILEKKLGPESADVAMTCNNLARAYFAEGRYMEAEPLYLRAMAIQEKVLGNGHPDVAAKLLNYADLLHKLHKNAEARKLRNRAQQVTYQAARQSPGSIQLAIKTCRKEGNRHESENYVRTAGAGRRLTSGAFRVRRDQNRASTMRTLFSGLIILACPFTGSAKVDFGRDVQPLFKQYCVDCHGPSQQMGGFRLDRRREALRGGTVAMIGPGNSAASKLYLRLIGNDYGMQMPPTGPLQKEQIRTIQAWIDEGAEWPDALAGEAPPTPVDTKAASIMEALRNGDRKSFERLLRKDPGAANRKGPGGATPLMYAALYADSGAVRRLLDAGGNPNVRNDAGATALMWAVPDIEKTRLLLDQGADANARSDDGRTPLLIASSWRNSSAALKLLLSRGAKPVVKSAGGFTTPLTEAAYIADEASIRTLIEGGAEMKQLGFAVALALWSRCPKCLSQLAPAVDPKELTLGLGYLASFGDSDAAGFLLDHGADPKGNGLDGRPVLLSAAASDTIPVGIVKAFLDRGADVNATSAKGETALHFARLRGDTPVVKLLVAAGAKDESASAPQAKPAAPAASARAALERSIPLLQRTDVVFLKKSGCVSCHNNTFTAMSVASARKKGIPVNEQTARTQLTSIAAYLDIWRDRLLQNVGVPGDADGCSYILLGLAAESHPPDAATDAAARFLASRQLPDGSWRIVAHRPPLESSDIEVTAVSMRALQVYAPKPHRAQYDKAVQLAGAWLAKAQPKTTEDRTFQLLGMTWAKSGKDAIRNAARSLISQQGADGGGAQLPTLPNDAYATGQALVALMESGAVSLTDSAFERGTRFLLNTQLADGSWYVKSRATPFQPYFESEFPHEHDQWISATATNWASLALAFRVR